MFITQQAFTSFLEPDEKVLHVFRKPFLFALWKIKVRFLAFGGAAFVGYFFYPIYPLIWIWIFLLGVAIVRVGGAYFYWYFNALVMTNESVIVIDWPSFFEKRYTRIDFPNLDEITVEKIGAQSFFMNYGTLQLNKINGGDTYEVQKINRPNRAARIIENYREKMIDQRNFMDESALKDLLSSMVMTHVEKHGIPERNAPLVPHASEKKSVSNFLEKIYTKWRSKSKNNIIEKHLDDTGGIDIELDTGGK